jgi:hypothetical protein
MKSLPKDHKHSWEVQQRERASKQFGYQVACKLARLITLGVIKLSFIAIFINFVFLEDQIYTKGRWG